VRVPTPAAHVAVSGVVLFEIGQTSGGAGLHVQKSSRRRSDPRPHIVPFGGLRCRVTALRTRITAVRDVDRRRAIVCLVHSGSVLVPGRVESWKEEVHHDTHGDDSENHVNQVQPEISPVSFRSAAHAGHFATGHHPHRAEAVGRQ
jgi:hypothetical protein